jgi:hypothetical protein
MYLNFIGRQATSAHYVSVCVRNGTSITREFIADAIQFLMFQNFLGR